MSWQDRIQEGIQITTGDGQVYTPIYFVKPFTVDYNVAEFNFPEVEGTLVNRGTPQGGRYDMEIVFQGDDHLDQYKAFEKSASDRRPWTVLHPYYDTLTVHPISLKFDPTNLNMTVVTGQLVETLTQDAPKVTQDPRDKATIDSNMTTAMFIATFAELDLSTQDNNQLVEDVAAINSVGVQAVKSGTQANEYFNLFTRATNAINTQAARASQLALFITDLIIYPFRFTDQVKNRLRTLAQQFEALSDSLDSLTTPNAKKIYEMEAGTVVNAAVLSAINPLDEDYTNAVDVLFVVGTVTNMYNSYVENIGTLQTDNGYDTGSYIPTYEPLTNLTTLVNFAVSKLFEIALTAQQQRTVILEEDSNPILLAHRFYGPGEDSIDRFIRENTIGLTEFYEIKRGREIVYYV